MVHFKWNFKEYPWPFITFPVFPPILENKQKNNFVDSEGSNEKDYANPMYDPMYESDPVYDDFVEESDEIDGKDKKVNLIINQLWTKLYTSKSWRIKQWTIYFVSIMTIR